MRKIVRQLNDRFGVWITNVTREEWRKKYAQHARDGQSVSDFVGMLANLAFCQGAGFYFFNKLATTHNAFLWIAFGTSLVICLILFFFLAVHINGMMYSVLAMSTVVPQNCTYRVLLFMSAWVVTISFAAGTASLVLTLGQALIPTK